MADEHGRLRTSPHRLRRRIERAVARRAPPIGILSYHRIAEPALDPWQLAVSPVNFADQLEALRAHGRFVPLERVTGAGRWAPGNTDRYVVTFDDGYADNLTAALPILERFEVPATIFVTTGFLDGGAFWWDVLDAAVLDSNHSVDALLDAGCATGILDRVVSTDRKQVQADLHAGLAVRRPLDAEVVIAQFLDVIGDPTPVPNGRPLTVEELVELAAHPLVSIGVHTVHHVRLPNASASVVMRELLDARDFLDRTIGAEPRALAYPHGDVSPQVAELAASAGFTAAVTTDHRWVAFHDDRMMLPRLTVGDVPGCQLRSTLQAARQW